MNIMKAIDRTRANIPDLSVFQMKEICQREQEKGLAKGGLGISIRPPFSNCLNGREEMFCFTDRTPLWYRFINGECLEWSEDGISYTKEYAQLLEIDAVPGVVFIHHLRAFTFPLKAFTMIFDTNTNLITLVEASIGDSIKRQRDVNREFRFGYSGNAYPACPDGLHHFDEFMVGKMVDWNYGGDLIMKHMYSNNIFMTYMAVSEGERSGLCDAAMADYVKINDRIYLFSWIETGGQGVQGIAMIDTAEWHDVGSFFGINANLGLDSHTFSAYGKVTDEITKYHYNK